MLGVICAVLTSTFSNLVGAASQGGAGSSSVACPIPSTHFDCDLQRSIVRAEDYARTRPGIVGIALRDRLTGASYVNQYGRTPIWAASTPKLAIAVDLLLRDRAHTIRLTATDRELMDKMLKASDNDAADTLWFRYGGESMAARFSSHGMDETTFSAQHPHTWGWIRTTAADLSGLIRYVLERMPDESTRYLVDELRSVKANQQWDVWGAGPAERPGNKNGWSDDDDNGAWVANSVGFVGENERYTLAMMNDTLTVKDEEVGKQTTTMIAEILFRRN
jgi:hypothetical protein